MPGFNVTDGKVNEMHLINGAGFYFHTNDSASQTAANHHIFREVTGGSLCVYNHNGIGAFLANDGTSWSPNASDRRLKKNIDSFKPLLNAFLKLNPSYFNYIIDSPEYPLRSGFIAQDMELVFPELVLKSNYNEELQDHVNTIDINGLIPYIVQAIKDQNEIVVSQQSQIDSLTQQLADLKALVQTLIPTP